MIPREAIEAAVRILPEYTPEDEADSFEREANEMCRAKVETILEAAAPHMMKGALNLADKWQEDFPYKANELRAALGVAND